MRHPPSTIGALLVVVVVVVMSPGGRRQCQAGAWLPRPPLSPRRAHHNGVHHRHHHCRRCVSSAPPLRQAPRRDMTVCRERQISRPQCCVEAAAAGPESLGKDSPLRGHMGGGAGAPTTCRLGHLWHHRGLHLHERLRLVDAGKGAHHPTRVGHLKAPCRATQPHGDDFRLVQTFYTPSLSVTILSPGSMSRQPHCRGHKTVARHHGGPCSLRLNHCRRESQDVRFGLVQRQGLLWSDPIIAPTTEAERTGPLPSGALHVRAVAADNGEASLPPATAPPDTTGDATSCCPPCSMNAVCGSCSPSPLGPAPNIHEHLASAPEEIIADKALWALRPGSQMGNTLGELGDHPHGIPQWPDDSPRVCGHRPESHSPCDPDGSRRAAPWLRAFAPTTFYRDAAPALPKHGNNDNGAQCQ